MKTKDIDAETLYYNLGYDSLLNGRYGEAVEQLTLAIHENIHFAEAYFARGICYHLQNKNELALEDMAVAKALGLDDAAHYIRLVQQGREKRILTEGEIWVNKIKTIGPSWQGSLSRAILDLLF